MTENQIGGCQNIFSFAILGDVAGVAQLVEHSTCNRTVRSSSLLTGFFSIITELWALVGVSGWISTTKLGGCLFPEFLITVTD